MKLRAGDKLDLYWKAQSNKSSYIGPVICSSITKICLSQNFLYIFDPKEKQKFIPVDMHQFAKSDGFKNCNDMVNYFMSDNRVGSVWKGFLISW